MLTPIPHFNLIPPGVTYPLMKNLLFSLLIANVLTFPIITIYTSNSAYLSFSFAYLLGIMACLFALVATISFGLLHLVRKRPSYPKIQLAILAITTTLWFQHAVLCLFFPIETSISYGDWQEDACFAIVNGLLLAVPSVIVYKTRNWCRNNLTKILLAIVTYQLVATTYDVFTYSTFHDSDTKSFTLSRKKQFTFGRKNNVFVIVMDCMGESLCKKTFQIFPETKNTLKDFICFDRMTSPLPRTLYAVPALLTGVNYDGKFTGEPDEEYVNYKKIAFENENSINNILHDNDFQCEAYPYILQAIKLSPYLWDNAHFRTTHEESWSIIGQSWLYRMLPYAIKAPFPAVFRYRPLFLSGSERSLQLPNETFDQTFYRLMKQNATVGEHDSVFKYYHLQGPHMPLLLDENMEHTPNTSAAQQLRGSFKIIETLIEQLKQLNLYDDSMIVITGDHTETYEPEIISFIKPPKRQATHLTVNSEPCSIADIHKTIFAELDILPRERSLCARKRMSQSLAPNRKIDLLKTLKFNPFKPTEKRSLPEISFDAYHLENDVLFIHIDEIGLDYIYVILEPIDNSKQSWETTATTVIINPNFNLVKIKNIPDGKYNVYLDAVSHKDSASTHDLPPVRLDHILTIQNGKPEFLDDL